MYLGQNVESNHKMLLKIRSEIFCVLDDDNITKGKCGKSTVKLLMNIWGFCGVEFYHFHDENQSFSGGFCSFKVPQSLKLRATLFKKDEKLWQRMKIKETST